MAGKIESKLIILGVLFIAASFFVYQKSEPPKVDHTLSLKDFLTDIDGYRIAEDIGVEASIYKFLDLDDYVFTNYIGKQGRVTLFVGFYYTANKMSAAHSPLVCYPAQGWKIDQPVMHTLPVGRDVIHYAEITAGIGGAKELVIYWYQANEDTASQVYRNKINTLYNKFTKHREQNAFVRVSVPLADLSHDEAQKAAIDFIKAFYPKFVAFIRENGNQ